MDGPKLQNDAPTVILVGNHSEADLSRLREAAPRASLIQVAALSEAQDTFSTAQVVAGSVPEKHFSAMPRLEWVHTWAAGPNADLHEEMLKSDIVLTSSAGNGAIPLAEHAMMLALILNRNYPRWAKAQQNHEWDRFVHGELAGQTMGIFGLGNSGTDLAAKAKSFHMRVVGLRRNPDRTVANVDHIYTPDQLHEFLRQSDIVVITAPLTEETRGVIDGAALRAMKQTSFLIVFSRGGIVDDDALVAALQNGWIAGAGLDAHGEEPLPENSPFWDLPSTIITPHNGATTARTAERGFDIFVENLRRYVSGRGLVNVVDKVAGY